MDLTDPRLSKSEHLHRAEELTGQAEEWMADAGWCAGLSTYKQLMANLAVAQVHATLASVAAYEAREIKSSKHVSISVLDEDELEGWWTAPGGKAWNLNVPYLDVHRRLWRWAGGYQTKANSDILWPLMSSSIAKQYDIPLCDCPELTKELSS